MLTKCIANRKLISKNFIYSWSVWRNFSQDIQDAHSNQDATVKQPQKSGYAKAFEKFEALSTTDTEKPQTFKELLMNSKFIDLGDPSGKIVAGKIMHVIDDDLYIDFGWKFHCVCNRPKTNSSSYVRGARVRLMIQELELSSRFLGYEKDLTLLEADCVLLGLLQDRATKTT